MRPRGSSARSEGEVAADDRESKGCPGRGAPGAPCPSAADRPRGVPPPFARAPAASCRRAQQRPIRPVGVLAGLELGDHALLLGCGRRSRRSLGAVQECERVGMLACAVTEARAADRLDAFPQGVRASPRVGLQPQLVAFSTARPTTVDSPSGGVGSSGRRNVQVVESLSARSLSAPSIPAMAVSTAASAPGVASK